MFKCFWHIVLFFFLLTMTDSHDMLSWASLCFVTVLITFCFYFLLFSFMFVLWVKCVNHFIEKKRCIIADSWFGSVKSAFGFMRQGLYSTMLVKTAYKDFPHQLLGEEPLQRGEWKAYTTNKDGVKLQACRFRDLKVRDFFSTCSSVIPGLPIKTKHHGKVVWPNVAYEYLKYAAAIDIHNHYRNGSAGLEDVWLTKSLHKKQLGGILGFYFTNAYLAMGYFGINKQPHYQFNISFNSA